MPDDQTGTLEPPGPLEVPKPLRAVVVGGGLAGLAAAHELAMRFEETDPGSPDPGQGILVVESNKLLGGKARSLREGKQGLLTQDTPPPTDKGYHIFPKWYWDMWAVMEEVGITTAGSHSKCSKDRCLVQEDSHETGRSRFTCPKEAASLDYTMLKLHPDETCEVVETSRYQARTLIAKGATLAVMLGLVGADGEKLDRRTLEDHLSRRWYAGNKTLERVREIVLKALANPSVDASARTTANTFRRWLPVYLDANWRALRGPLQAELIEPFVESLKDRGVTFEEGRPLAAARVFSGAGAFLGRGEAAPSVKELRFGDGSSIDTDDVAVVFALPAPTLNEVVKWDVVVPPKVDPPHKRPGGERLDPGTSIRALTYLESAPMASLDLYVNALPHIGSDRQSFPEAHFSLVGSQYAITGFAASQVWHEKYLQDFPVGAKHVIQFVCSDVGPLVELEEPQALDLLRADIGRFVPELGPRKDGQEDTVVDAVLLMNKEPAEQVTRNEAGTWDKRPAAEVGFSNAWIAGDFCRCPVDVASMEAAVSTGLLAGAEAGRALGLKERKRSRFPAPVRGWPHSWSNRIWRKVIALVAFLGAGLSFAAGTILRVLTLPYILARRYATHDLTLDPYRRRARDNFLICCGLAVVPVGAAVGVAALNQVEGFDPWADPYSDLGRVGSDGRWVIAVGCWVLYLLMMLFAVPTRRFLPWSRQATTGFMLAGLGYLAFPFLPVAANGDVPFMHYVAAVAILLGPNWSVIGSRAGLRHPEAAYKWLGRIAAVWAWFSTFVIAVTIVVSIFGAQTFAIQAFALFVGHLWTTALAVFLLLDQGPARSQPGRTVEAPVEYIATAA